MVLITAGKWYIHMLRDCIINASVCDPYSKMDATSTLKYLIAMDMEEIAEHNQKTNRK